MKRMISRWIFLGILLFLTQACYAAGENIALGKKYRFSPEPSPYSCADSGDAVQLTDGATTDRDFWTSLGTVGWNGPWVDLTIDLEQEEPISSVAFTSAVGREETSFPTSAFLFVSPNGEEWYSIGDLMMLDLEENGERIASKPNVRKISVSGLSCKGRYVKILFYSKKLIYTDEVEIGRGEESTLEIPYPDTLTPDPLVWAEETYYFNLIRSRYIIDAHHVADEILKRSRTVDSPRRENLVVLAEKTRAIRVDEHWLSELPVATFKTLFPYDSVHASLFAALARMERIVQPNIAPLQVDRVLPYDSSNPITGGEKIPEESIFMASGEIKPVVYQLLNTTNKMMTVSFSFDGEASPLFQNCSSVRWIDSRELVPEATALVPLKKTRKDSYELTLYPGLTTQIWIDVNAKGKKAGDYRGSIQWTAGKNKVKKSLLVQISRVTLPEEQTLVLGGWDYTDFGGHDPVTMKNFDSFISILKEFGVNGVWGSPELLTNGLQIDTSNSDRLSVAIDTNEAKKWITRWAGAKEYYLSVPETFAGYSYDAPEFKPLVADWAKKWGNWFESNRISPSSVSFLIHDEPGIDPNEDTRPIVAWAEAIRAGEPRFRIWEDPIYHPVTTTPKELLDLCDTLSPKRTQWMEDRKGFQQTYRPLVAAGKRLDFYSCSGPVLLFDPYTYYRLQAWHLFREGGRGSFFWAFFDGTGTPWNTYLETRDGFSPLMIEPEHSEIIPTKQMAAMRESVYDFEILTMYQNRLQEAKSNGKKIEEEEKWLRDQLDALLEDPAINDIQWRNAKDRTGADRIREEILRRLEAML